jgi:replicative DNA helicase
MHVAKDPVVWEKNFLQVQPRVYQILILRDPSLRKVLRAGRRLGKTFTLAITLLHYSYTHKDGRCLVIAPMKTQVELIYQEIGRIAGKNEVVMNSITRKVSSPQFMMEFSNGSTIRFFTSGMRSGGKSDVARGQEAHVIVLDEMDYMHTDDLDALYAMLQKTAEDQPDKMMIGASTPTGRREKFWEWCRSERFKEFWFPSYCNPYFSKEQEDEFREQYTEMGYRHEIEADWGEDSEGVYPRKFVDKAFLSPSWTYEPEITSARSFHVIGVDWDKYGAGTNIVVVEACSDNHEDPRFRGRSRVAYREEIARSEYTLTKAVDRIFELNEIFKPKHIYVDRGFGEVQVELLHKYGVENPKSGLREKVKGVSFAEAVEVRDPYTKMLVKKEIKPYMVDNLRQFLEKEKIVFPESDEELYLQLISYVVIRTTQIGRPIFEASGTAMDHAHDALMLALLAITQNYGEFSKGNYAMNTETFSNDFYMPKVNTVQDNEEKPKYAIVGRNNGLAATKFNKKSSVISNGKRKMF